MGARHRTRPGITLPQGFITLNGNPFKQDVPYIWTGDSCDDVTGSPKEDHAFNSIKIDLKQMGTMSGTYKKSDNYVYVFSGHRPEAYAAPPAHLAVLGLPSINDAAMSCLAQTNPGRAGIGAIENLVDIKDLPKLLKLASGGILRKVAGANITWQFGWKPLISDIKKALDFSSQVDKRLKEMNNLYKQGGQHSSRKCGSDTVSSQSRVVLCSESGFLAYANKSITTTARRWATVRWTAPMSAPKPSNDAMRKKARQAVSGLYLNASTAWDAIPWSWFIDWFSNFGDWLKANNQLVPCGASTVCVMTETKTTVTITPGVLPPGVTCGIYSATITTKNRVVVAPSVSASLPVVTKRMVSILGSLAILRHR